MPCFLRAEQNVRLAAGWIGGMPIRYVFRVIHTRMPYLMKKAGIVCNG